MSIFVWQFWIGLILGYLVLGRIVSAVRARVA